MTFFRYLWGVKSVIDIFVELGERLHQGMPHEVVVAAYEQNRWFSELEIGRSVEAIVDTMLDRGVLIEWLGRYPELPKERSERILIVMAGNIPLVGFFDLLCVIASGSEALVKCSHKDRILMEWVISMLREIEPMIPIFIYNESMSVDRVIATGGDAAVQFFESKYRSLPTLLRGSRHSVAVLSEGEEECIGLEKDLYYYSGLGCRNVSMIFAPRGYDLSTLPKTQQLNEKYTNNLHQSRALLRMTGVEFFDNGSSCFVHQPNFPQRISIVSVVEYDSIEEVERWLTEHDEEIQCVVANKDTLQHPRRCDFGRAQYPTLLEYADGVDTMNFLIAK